MIYREFEEWLLLFPLILMVSLLKADAKQVPVKAYGRESRALC